MKLNYDSIQKEAVTFSLKYRQIHELPKLPEGDEFKPYKKLLFTEYPRITNAVFEHIVSIRKLKDAKTAQNDFKPDINGPYPGITEDSFCYEHLEWVALLASYLAADECNFRKLSKRKTDSIIRITLLSGLLHDIERHFGFGELHAVEGEKTAKLILEGNDLGENMAKTIAKVVRHHDDINFDAGGNTELSVAYGCVFDSDKFRFGLERQDIFWRMKKAKGVSVAEVIHDYKFLPPLRNVWHTKYGRKVGPKLIDFGLAVAKYIESTFSSS